MNPSSSKSAPGSSLEGDLSAGRTVGPNEAGRTASSSGSPIEGDHDTVGGSPLLRSVSEEAEGDHPEDMNVDQLRVRIRELEAQKLEEDRMRAYIREMEGELAMRRERTARLNAFVDFAFVVLSNRAAAAEHVRKIPSIVDDDYEANLFWLQDEVASELRAALVSPPPTVSRSSSTDSLQSLGESGERPNKKSRHS